MVSLVANYLNHSTTWRIPCCGIPFFWLIYPFVVQNYRCIPYKLDKNVQDKNCRVEDSVRVLMISTPNRKDLVFPKVHFHILPASFSSQFGNSFIGIWIKGLDYTARMQVNALCAVKIDAIVWFFKGGWEDDETLDQAACREAMEEAGVTGLLGVCHFIFSAWDFHDCFLHFRLNSKILRA